MVQLNKLFDVSYGNKFDLNKLEPLPRAEGGIGLVGRSQNNHGISATVARVDDVEPYPAGLITVALGGTKLLSSFVQEFPFYTAQNVAVLRPLKPLNFAQKVYFCLCIRTNRFRYGAFGREANRTLKILEVPNISDIPKWVGAYSPTKEGRIEEVLSSVESLSDIKPARVKPTNNSLQAVNDIFDVFYGSNLELNRLQREPDGVNFVSRTARNNGISARVRLLPELPPIPGGVLTVAGGGSVLETFYQAEPFYSGRDLYVLRPLQPMTPEEMLFYARVIRANQYRFSYGRQANRTLKDLLIPSRSTVPEWVYGSARRVVQDIKRHTN